jgi:16S rRNA (adenine1518-N6/adenine1519-N6)-dimethyltransferase
MNELRDFCHTHGLWLNTKLGQHFLEDLEILQKIVDAADIQPSDHIVEIGPGIGVLTKGLLEKARRVTAIELDTRLVPLLRIYTNLDPKLEVVNGNALHYSMPNEPYKIVANIPYHITSPLLHHVFLESKIQPTSMTLLIQREVAEKICDTKKAGLLTILVHLFGTPKIITHVPPKAFLPPPKVDSSVLHIACFDKPIADAETIQEVFRLTKMAFTHKRKKLNNSLGKQTGGMELLEATGIDSNRRPEELLVEEWIRLAARLGED